MASRKRTDPNLPAAPGTGGRTPIQSRDALRQKVRMFYDLQSMRIQVSGRIGPKAEGAELQLHEFDKAVLERRSRDLLSSEKSALQDVEDHLKDLPFYVNTLSDKERYRGIGPTMAGVILSEFAIEREDTVSKMWAFAGLAPLKAVRCRHCHRVVENIVDSATVAFKHQKGAIWIKGTQVKCPKKDEELTSEDLYDSGKSMGRVKGEKLRYNAFLRTKLVGVLGPVLLKCGSPWRVHYDNYKNRKIAEGWGINDAHRHVAAIRYMVKMLLLDIWKEWRAAENLPIRPSYAEEKLGHIHSGNKPNSNQRGNDPVEKLDPEIEAELQQVG